MSLHEYLQRDPDCGRLAEGALLAVAPLLQEGEEQSTLALLETWALDLAARMPLPWSLHAAIDALNHFLFTEKGIAGDRQSYDDPRNAVLSQVILRRRGLPIALSILWVDLARRLGFDARGVALPGHFVTALRTDVGDLYFDPFDGGRALGDEEAARLVRRASRGQLDFDPSMLQPVTHRAILARLVRNLHIRFARQEAWEEALWTSTHLVLLCPEDPAPYRDRAFVRLKRGDLMPALEDLKEAVRLGQGGDPEVKGWIERLQNKD